MTPNRSKVLIIATLAVAAFGLAWLLLAGDLTRSHGQLRAVTLRYWGYGSPPSNPVGSWLARHIRWIDRKRPGTTAREPLLLLDGLELLWSYSNPTSGWFQFGNMVGSSNLCYWSFALPEAREPMRALAEFPQLSFLGPESKAWTSLVGEANCDFRSNAVGHGGIRLPVGRCLFVRHTSDSNRTYLVQCDAIKPGTWGDTKVTFRHETMPPLDPSDWAGH